MEAGNNYDRAWTRKRFAEIALLIMQAGREEEITRDSVIKALAPRFLDRGADGDEVAEFEAEEFLDSQELRSGLLISRKSRVCRFVHLTFQEYLAA
jgi:predicted NACHT family NTPase